MVRSIVFNLSPSCISRTFSEPSKLDKYAISLNLVRLQLKGGIQRLGKLILYISLSLLEMPESVFLLNKMKMNLRQIKLFWTYILICVHLIAQWIHPILIIRHPETRMCTPKVPYVYTLILILTLLYINIEGCQYWE